MKSKNIFKRSISSLVKWAFGQTPDAVSDPTEYVVKSFSNHPNAHDSFEDINRGLNLTVYNATGGKVVQVFSYDPMRDRRNSALYIVTDGSNLGEELGMIITREKLSQ